MPTLERRRLPISARHAFALAFDLALRRDPIHSLVVPLLLRAPWGIALILMPPVDPDQVSVRVLMLTSVALIGDFLTLLVVSAMLRLRARSVFNTPPGVRPAPVAECYTQGMRRIPWLLTTEVARNLLIALAASLMVLPAAFFRFSPEHALFDLGRNLVLLAIAFLLALPTLSVVYRLAVATEAVVLLEHDLAIDALATTMGVVVFGLLLVIVWPIIQYAWTFFYLRLVEMEYPPIVEPGPMYAGSGGTPMEASGGQAPVAPSPTGTGEAIAPPSPALAHGPADPGVSETNASA
jgi:hypothetical protein